MDYKRRCGSWLRTGLLAGLVIFSLAGSACSVSSAGTINPENTNHSRPATSGNLKSDAVPEPPPTITWNPPTPPINEIMGTPTPDPIREPPPARTDAEYYQVQYGDSLNSIALRFNVSPIQLIESNEMFNPDILSVGEWLLVPAPVPQAPGPSLKIIPNSELVYGPASIFASTQALAEQGNGYLWIYAEEVDGELKSGAEIVELVSQRYSVNPLLILAVLEYQGGWLTKREIQANSQIYPVGFVADGWDGLYSQLAWAADQLNLGYYRWRAGWAGPYIMSDGSIVMPGPGINAGTAGIQQLFSQLYPVDDWRRVVDQGGFEAKLRELFGDPFERQVEPLLPGGLTQPELQLPFEQQDVWSFTGGPHSSWGQGAAWGALDFAPPGFAFGCVPSEAWALAVGEGVIIRAGEGEVILDLDGDGFEQTGWSILYMHVENRDRVGAGDYVRSGDRIGHPSCEGGVTTGTHIHIARKYNGEWIPADGDMPFVMDNWVSEGLGAQYDGLLIRGNEVREACACRNEENQVAR